MKTRTWLIPLLCACLSIPLLARGDEDEEGEEEEHHERGGKGGPALRTALASPEWPTYVKECGSCHMAFPPAMLPAKSWKALLGGLTDHFGENAELDAPTRARLEAFLSTSAGSDVPGPTPLRITTLPSWIREHREVGASTYKRKSILTPANCGACHPGANQGAFGEHQVKIPR